MVCLSIILYIALFTVVSEDHRCLYDDIDYNQHMVNILYIVYLNEYINSRNIMLSYIS